MAAKAKPKGIVGKHRWLVFGVIAVVAVLGYLWWRNRGASADAAQSSAGAPWWQTEGATGGATGSGGAPPVVPGPGGGSGGGATGGGGGDGGGGDGGGSDSGSYPGSPTYAVVSESSLNLAHSIFNTKQTLNPRGLATARRAFNQPAPRFRSLPESPKYVAAPAQQYETQVPNVPGGGGRLVDV